MLRLQTGGTAEQGRRWMKSNDAYQSVRRRAEHTLGNGLILSRQRLLKAGSLGGDTLGGIINPGALAGEDGFQLLCRAERDESTWRGDWFQSRALPIWCIFDHTLSLCESFRMSYEKIPEDVRAEDWRLFRYKGAIYSNHSVYESANSELRCRPCLSRVSPENGTLHFERALRPPFPAQAEEKNWAMFVHDGDLMCIYSVRPYLLLRIEVESGKVEELLRCVPEYAWQEDGFGFVGSSTNPVSWDSCHYILFIHNYVEPPPEMQRQRIYLQYGVLISKSSLLPTSVIPIPLLIGGSEDGRHPGVHYTTSLVNREEGLYAFHGEGDSHTGVAVFDKDELAALFDRYQVEEPG